MLNTPNEWHNNQNTNEEEYAEDENYAYDEYSDDGEYSDEYEDEEYSDEEYSDEYEDEDGEYDDGGNNGSKKTLTIIAVIILVLLLIGGGAFGLKQGLKNKSVATNDQALMSEVSSEDMNELSGEESNVGMGFGEDSESEDVSIDVDTGSDNETQAAEGEPQTQNTDESQLANNNGAELEVDVFGNNEDENINQKNDDNVPKKKVDISDEASSLSLTTTGGKDKYDALKNKNKESATVSIALGDIGRSDPFLPPSGDYMTQKKSIEELEGLDFEVIEPPELGPVQPAVSRLLNTKVSGILYDEQKPSAIINIDGADQLVRIGDVIENFEFVDITKNKVVIRSDSNVYRASVGQPLNAEKINNQIEISNLETKFLGSRKIQ